MSAAAEILAYLDALGIAYREAAHPPAATMADCAATDAKLGCLTPKNIFLTTKNGKRFYLCLTRPEARFHTADISKQAGASRLSFAPEDALLAVLRARPGSASPLGLMFESARDVTLLVDAALRDAPSLGFHPCDNTRTLVLARADFFGRFLPAVDRTPVFVEIHDFISSNGAEAPLISHGSTQP